MVSDRETDAVLYDDAGLKLPECLRWHAGTLYFSDMELGIVYRTDLSGSLQPVVEVEQTPCGLGWSRDGDLLVVSRHDRRLLRIPQTAAPASSEGVTEQPGSAGASAVVGSAVELSEIAGSDLNDMVVIAGRAYIGAFGYDYLAGEPAAPAPIVLVDEHAGARVAADGLDFPNGMVVVADRGELYVAETWVGRISAFRIAEDGSLRDRRVFADLRPRMPDGICLDAAGALWVGCPISHELVRVLDGGEITDIVRTPGRHCMSCALGGPDGRTLIVGTTDTDFDPLQPTRMPMRPSSGRIEMLDVAVEGVAMP
jgi:sugar lactone lactonase YvrE